MQGLELRLMCYPGFKAIFWAYFEVDIPEWTLSEYCHQN